MIIDWDPRTSLYYSHGYIRTYSGLLEIGGKPIIERVLPDDGLMAFIAVITPIIDSTGFKPKGE